MSELEKSPVQCFLECGGLMMKIKIDGKVYEFEDHPFCGPNILYKNGTPLPKQPLKFLTAASLWCQQGKRMEGEFCRWDYPAEPIIERIDCAPANARGLAGASTRWRRLWGG